MKSLFHPTLLLCVLLFASCNQKAKKNSIQGDSANRNENYDPGEGWSLVWADEFDGDSLNASNWNRQVEPAGRFNGEWQRYTNDPANAYVENGNLIIEARHEGETHGMNQYTSARLNTAGKQTWKFGKIAARIKLPHGHGIWPAFWMLGANINENGGDTPWPQCGEIDILELYGSKDDAIVEANIHYANAEQRHASMGSKAYALPQGKFADDYHIFELEWTAKRIRWFVDGNEYASSDISGDVFSEFREEFFILLNIAVGGAFDADDTTEFPQKMFVDWVRVYQE